MTASGETTLVVGAGSITLTPTLSLYNCLLVLALSNHLLSLQGNEFLVGATDPNQKEGNVQLFDMVAI